MWLLAEATTRFVWARPALCRVVQRALIDRTAVVPWLMGMPTVTVPVQLPLGPVAVKSMW